MTKKKFEKHILCQLNQRFPVKIELSFFLKKDKHVVKAKILNDMGGY